MSCREEFGSFAPTITRRGRFFQDDFFSDYTREFDDAIQNVMNRWGGKSLLADHFSLLKDLRHHNKDEPQDADSAASISETKDNYVIVLEMSNYVQGDMSVRTSGRFAVVEATCGPKTFFRRYPLPADVNYDAVTAALSDDGILTITAPKKSKTAAGTDSSNIPPGQPKYLSSLKIDMGQPEESATGAGSKGRVISLATDEAEEATKEEPSQPSPPLSPPTSPKPDRLLSINKRGRFFQDSFFENVWKDFENALNEMVDRESKTTDFTQRQMAKERLADKIHQKMASSLQGRREQQQQATAKETAQSAAEASTHLSSAPRSFQRLNSYNNLREWNFGDDTQAATVTRDSSGYKIILDMKGQAAEDLAVKATEGEIVVSGKHGDWTCNRKFSLPGLTMADEVKASLSEEGILTITAPL